MNVLTSRLRLFLAALALNFFWLPTAPAAVWVTNSLMSTPRQYQTASLLPNGKVLVAGGCNASTAFASAELFDPATGSWSAATAMPFFPAPRYMIRSAEHGRRRPIRCRMHESITRRPCCRTAKYTRLAAQAEAFIRLPMCLILLSAIGREPPTCCSPATITRQPC